MHEDDEERDSSDKRDADEVQPNSQPTHGATEEVVGGLVVVKQLLISTERQRDKRRKKQYIIFIFSGNAHWLQRPP